MFGCEWWSYLYYDSQQRNSQLLRKWFKYVESLEGLKSLCSVKGKFQGYELRSPQPGSWINILRVKFVLDMYIIYLFKNLF